LPLPAPPTPPVAVALAVAEPTEFVIVPLAAVAVLMQLHEFLPTE
jgi:hypothetical protein